MHVTPKQVSRLPSSMNAYVVQMAHYMHWTQNLEDTRDEIIYNHHQMRREIVLKINVLILSTFNSSILLNNIINKIVKIWHIAMQAFW